MVENSVIPTDMNKISEAGRDPLSKIIEITKDKSLTDEDKKRLISIALNRFSNRRKMAYISLYAIVSSLAFIFIAAFIDGLVIQQGGSSYKGIMSVIKDNQTLIIWIETFLTSIITAYYGISAWKPSS